MSEHIIKRVGVIGTGVIGISWATHFLGKGLHVTASDPGPDAENKLRNGIRMYAPDLPQDRLHFEQDPAVAVQDVQFVQENGPERLELKKDLFKLLDAATPPDVLLVSSSSGIAVSEFQAAAVHPQRILLGHPFNPPHLIPLVEVCGGKATAETAIQRTMDFYEAIGKKPVRLRKEMKGHIANRLQAALWQEAFYLVQQGVASVEDIDLAISQGPGLRWALLGPFLNLHLSGGEGGIRHSLEHLGPPMESWMKDLGKVEINQALIDLLSQGVSRQLEGRNLQEIIRERNKVLVALMALKSNAELL